MTTYQILFQEEPEGGYTVTVPALPGCISYGKTLAQARERIAEAIQGYTATSRKRMGMALPSPMPTIALSTVTV
jgi:predicted RNase H-like HicB family nuclease